MQIVITDCEYRSAVALVRSLGQAGHTLTLVRSEEMTAAPAFSSKFAARTQVIHAKVNDPAYRTELQKICESIGHPVLLPVGAKTIDVIVRHRAEFDAFCKVLLPEKEIMDQVNDKAYVQRFAEQIGIATPKTFTGTPDRFPVIVKPRCGEKFGLKAHERYLRADDKASFDAAYQKMRQYDDAPVVQEYVDGEGIGVCVVMGQDGKAASVFCHRRIRQYPVSGGPSTCCETFYDETLAEQSVRLLREMHYVGIAMVEYKGMPENCKLLEINPRVWGSFPLTFVSHSHFAEQWLAAANGEKCAVPDTVYQRQCRMRFLLNDSVCILALMKAGRWKEAWGGIKDAVSPKVKEALFDRNDIKPFFRYVVSAIRRT